MKKQTTTSITNSQIAYLQTIIGKLKTKSLGLDEFEKFVDAKRNLKESLNRLADIEKELIEKYNIKFTDETHQFFDVAATTKEERESFNKDVLTIHNKAVSIAKFITKKSLLALKNENDLSVNEYELLYEAFAKTTEPEPKPE